MLTPADWILSAAPWVEYRARLDLLEQAPGTPQVAAARQAMLCEPKIQGLVQELRHWPGSLMKRHNDAGHLLHKLVFIADLGIQIGDPGIEDIVQNIFARQSSQGPFQILVNISPAYGGSGEDQLAWMLCDAPLILYALEKFGLQDNPRVQTARQFLTSLIQENGWPCTVASELGKFRGPGRKTDPCPYATLVMLKALSQAPDADRAALKTGVDTLLNLWQQRKEKKIYLFGMGTDFNKLKAPLIWFDLLNVLDTLSLFPWTRHEPRFLEMLAVLKSKADHESCFTPESVWTSWKDWDFGQKKVPSPWVTLIAHRVLQRVEGPFEG